MGAVVIVVGILITLHRCRRDGLVMPRALGWIGKAVVLMVWLVSIAPPGSPLVGAELAPLAILLLAPAPILRRGVVPLGLPQLAYWAARIASPIELINDSGLGACYGALALRRARSPQRSVAWLAGRIDGARFPRGPGIVAAGLLAAARGDLDTARALLGCADTLDRRLIRPDVRVIARDWLVADAAHHGDWRAAIRVGRRGWRSLRWSYGVARLGERLIGAPARGHAVVLCLCWAVAPRRRTTFPLLRRALRASGTKVPDGPAAADLPVALANLAQRLDRRHAEDASTLVGALSTLEDMLDRPSVQQHVDQRLETLHAPASGVPIVSCVRMRLVAGLVCAIEDVPRLGTLASGSRLLDQASDEVRARWFKDIETQCRDYAGRTDRETALATSAEWEAWAILRRRADRLLELAPMEQQSLFQAMYLPVNNFAVFQQNKRKRRALAHDMYAWLGRHSRHDAAASRLVDKNIRSSRP